MGNRTNQIALAWNNDDVEEANALVKAIKDDKYTERGAAAEEEYERTSGWVLYVLLIALLAGIGGEIV